MSAVLSWPHGQLGAMALAICNLTAAYQKQFSFYWCILYLPVFVDVSA